ncbi:hydantoinase/oxoprolinase family protein [Bosea sp. (in: a-proteobacteria)]|uniref:hydantoinase/oxoprolinase family protein n=1 Tax=Bosea sp. (in: a-proteobacteria) TaxID=1871050 RepID=UPI002635A852|nr:hydantoinase/oxoprolinase family protein [Bosea sp. (in: a-proteobacteria)]MCO5091331.1 hydantoinase/oxoprolinase family protein [Bosea sp. (in: a-proteobacteria)]
MGLLIGIDAGGTFTDLMVHDTETGLTYSHKTSSTPANPADAIVRGIEELLACHRLPGASVERVSHGTTVGTNALLQRSGARISLITTRGFRDLIEIGRQTRPYNFDMHTDFPPPVVPRHRRVEIEERVGADGSILAAVDQSDLDRAIGEVLREEPEAVAVCFLFGYLNPVHELEVKRALGVRAPKLFVSTSSEVQPEFREYERISTTVLNAYLQPAMARYLDAVDRELAIKMPGVRVAISRSNGGLMSLPLSKSFPIRTALSGPAAGVIGAASVLRSAGRPNAITFDMGGTSADVALILDHECGYRHASSIGGFPIRMPMLDIHTVGAGGGSIAWFDKDNLLKVGPRSAGAVPGPAAYDKGGVEPTVTDANVALGRLSPAGLLGGAMRLDQDLARQAVNQVAVPLALSVEHAACGIIDIVTSNMVRAIRAITVERGFDPRDFALVAFGGAGPLHARSVAAELGIGEILVPSRPGLLCAAGALTSRFKEDLVRTVNRPIRDDADLSQIASGIAELLDQAKAWSAVEVIDPATVEHQVVLDMRYMGQNFELPIPLSREEIQALPQADTLRDRFFTEHDRQYGFHAPDGVIEVVNIRMTAESGAGPGLVHDQVNVDRPAAVPRGTRTICFDISGSISTPVYWRDDLVSGQKLIGPAVVDQLDTTSLLFPGDGLEVDTNGNLIIAVKS